MLMKVMPQIVLGYFGFQGSLVQQLVLMMQILTLMLLVSFHLLVCLLVLIEIETLLPTDFLYALSELPPRPLLEMLARELRRRLV
jgi:hypothetical protein